MSRTRKKKSRTPDPTPGEVRTYTGASLKMISFPLGGIGTGTIGLGGRGHLTDWEIFNNPNFGHQPPYTAGWIFCRQRGSRNKASQTKKVARILERRLLPPYHNSHGLSAAHLCGLPRLAEATFTGMYPTARIEFHDDDLPVKVELEAFNPMIPGDAEDSAIPVAILIYRVTNPTSRPVSGSIAWSAENCVGQSGEGVGGNVNTFRDDGACRGIHMTSKRYRKRDYGYGTQALLTTARRVTWATDFDEPGHAFDRAQKIWDDFRDDGRLDGPTDPTPPSKERERRIGMVAAEFRLKPGASTEIPFIFAWSFPQRPAGWHYPKGEEPRPVRNHYARRFDDAWTAGRYVVDHFDDLRERTHRFTETLFASTLPPAVLDAVSSQMSILRTNTTMWLDSPPREPMGRVFAFEGCSPTSGCCPMNCTHVWNYEQSMAHLYPSLERTMRRTDYEDNVHDAGAMVFRTTLPLRDGLDLWAKHLPAADGQFGTVVKAYREWRISGDDAWLKKLWPEIRRTIRFAWEGSAGWDADKDGVMEGVQHNTYDIEFFGPNTMCGSLYLAALKAGVEMARAVGDDDSAAEFAEVFESGRSKQDRMLFNGEYYAQKVIEQESPATLFGHKPKDGGKGYPKYQYGYGCLSDQLLGQWAAHVAGLGYVLPPEHVRSAVEAVYHHNFRKDLSAHESVQRTYALNEEAGLLCCTWPRGRRESFPFIYSDEVWTGIEYQVAAHLIYEGKVKKGVRIVQGVRDRHDGIARNPWNEFECGDHYARAMSSWSVLLALSGQEWDGRRGRLTMRPRIGARDFACLFTASDAYGLFRQTAEKGKLTVELTCEAGTIELRELGVACPSSGTPGSPKVRAFVGGKRVAASVEADEGGWTVALDAPADLAAGDEVRVRLR